ncbi:MAG: class I SAM-dependent methyltransferase [Gemmatimonadaceae bacterium]|nr:class I SAM-dependent methyltransferase [Gemmatimonadaceae bacterium]
MEPTLTVPASFSDVDDRERVRCNSCHADNFDVLIADGRDRRHHLPGEFRLVKCRECSLVYLNPRPTAEALGAYYPPDYAPYAQRGLLGKLTRWLRRREALGLRRSLPTGAEVLEVGCAAGDLLVPLRDAGFRVTGVELSDHAATIARTQHHLDVHTGTLGDAALEGRSFDAVIMRNVIEHVPDPTGDLEKAASLLRPGGSLSLRTDNVASLDARLFRALWYGYDFPRHLTLFSPETLAACVRSAGLEIVQVQYSLVPTHWIMSLRYWVSERRGMAPVSRLISPRNPLLLAAGFAIAAVQKVVQNSGRFMVLARKPMAAPTTAPMRGRHPES